MTDDSKLSSLLGIRSMKDITPTDENTEIASVVPVVIEEQNDETLEDIEKVRQNISNIIQKGTDSLEDIIDLAKQLQSPKAFDSLALIMKTLLDANKDYIQVAEKKKMTKDFETPKQTNVTNNLILSTSDLIAMINGKKDV